MGAKIIKKHRTKGFVVIGKILDRKWRKIQFDI